MTNPISSLTPVINSFHSFHIVDASPWPFFTSFSAFFRVSGLVLHRHSFKSGLSLFGLGLFALIVNVTFWWRDVIRESTFEGQHTSAVQTGLRFGRILFIVSEVRLFFAFFWAFFHASLNPTPSIGAVWPPKGIEIRDPWLIPLLNTALLLTSGAALTWSHSGLLGGYFFETNTGLIFTIVLASIFTGFQAYEYLNAPFSLADGIYGSAFYRLTGLHGFHVIVGTIFLSVALYRNRSSHFTTSSHVGYESAGWYWHFVDVVWIILFIAIYAWGDSVNLLKNTIYVIILIYLTISFWIKLMC